MKKILKNVAIIFTMAFLCVGCLNQSEKNIEESKSRDIVAEILELANSKQTRTAASEVKDVSTGVVSGVYLKIGTVIYAYTFSDIAGLSGTDKTDFLDRWNASIMDESYIIFENKAVTVATAKSIFETPGAKLSTAMASGLDSSSGGFAIQPTVEVIVYPLPVYSTIKRRADRKTSMVLVPAGTTSADNGNITVSNNFYIGKYEVTQAEWQAVMGNNPSSFAGKPNNPVECVSWYDVVEYCNARSIQEGLTPYYTYTKVGDNNLTNVDIVAGANGYRLPTDAEWEYAARGGAGGSATTYSGSNNIEDVAWYWDNSGYTTHEVGTKSANELGIYDMSGNVWEWCYDWYPEYEGSNRVERGGSWDSDYGYCAVAYRLGLCPDDRYVNVGFRLARNADTILVSLSNITIKTQVEKTTYIVGETFSTSGLEIEAIMSDGSKKNVTGWTTSTPDMNTSGTKIVIVSYSEAGVTKSVEFEIQVTPEGMVLVPAGTTSADNGNITVSNNFYIGKYEVTQAEWQAVMGNNPSSFAGKPNNPVEQVSWYDTIVFCNKKSIAEGLTPVYSISGSTNPDSWGTVPTSNDTTWNAVSVNSSANGYRLPTDAEWEYAARGGAGGSATTYAGSNNIEEVAWYYYNSGNTSHTVGTKLPNELGIYDMSGNVWEWCYDWDPDDEGSFRVRRGGSWHHHGGYCTVAYRYYGNPNNRSNVIGLRLARSF